jgi:hypothetical protein
MQLIDMRLTLMRDRGQARPGAASVNGAANANVAREV